MNRVPRLVKELGAQPSNLHRGRLAEDYDGIGQYVLVALAGAAVGSGYKARIAAGDFGGGRTFPAGTPVTVFSNRGQLEVFLGNKPGGCIENFAVDATSSGQDLTESPEHGQFLWPSQFGPPWYAPNYSKTEFNTIYVEDGQLVMDVKFRDETSEAERLIYVQSDTVLEYPTEFLLLLRHDQSPYPPVLGGRPFLSFFATYKGDAPINNYGWTCDFYYRISGSPGWTLEAYANGFNTSSGQIFAEYNAGTGFDTREPFYIRVRITSPENPDSEDGGKSGIKAKVWSTTEAEPDSYQAYSLYTNYTLCSNFKIDEIVFYSEDLGNASFGKTYIDFIQIVEGGCITGTPDQVLTGFYNLPC